MPPSISYFTAPQRHPPLYITFLRKIRDDRATAAAGDGTKDSFEAGVSPDAKNRFDDHFLSILGVCISDFDQRNYEWPKTSRVPAQK